MALLQLAQPRVPTGIIAGYLTPTPWLNRRFKTANDGLVAVYSTRLVQMQDFIVLPSIHATLECRCPTANALVFKYRTIVGQTNQNNALRLIGYRTQR